MNTSKLVLVDKTLKLTIVYVKVIEDSLIGTAAVPTMI